MIAGFAGTLRPSSAHVWGAPDGCPAAPRMQALFPRPEGIEAREGTAAHHLATEGALGRVVVAGDAAPNGVAITDDMVRGGTLFINAVQSRRSLASHTAIARVETKVFAHATIHPQNEGTPDAFILDGAAKRLDVYDYKFGFAFVPEFRNRQLLNYAAAIMETSGYGPGEWDDWTVAFHVIQPRYFSKDPVRSWTTTGAEVWRFAMELRDAAIKATAPNAPAIAGDHCYHCEAFVHCAAARRLTGHALSVASQGVPDGMDAAAIGVQLLNVKTALKRLEGAEKALEAEGMARVEAGERVTHFRRGNASTKERWEDPASALSMGRLFGVDLAAEVEPVSPFQARQKFKEKRIDEAVIAAYASRPKGKAKLVRDDETAATQIFGGAPVKPD